jgi:hypothetical protein
MAFCGQIAALCAAAGLAFSAIGCGNDSSPTTPTSPPAEPTISERYAGTLGVGATGFYSFSVTQSGRVNATLTNVSGNDGAPALGMGLGTPSGFDCSVRASTTASPGPEAQVTDVLLPGVYCVRVFDVGNLTAPVTFDVTIAHP